MLFRNISPEDVILEGTGIVQVGFKGVKIVVTYGKPALEKSAYLTAQVRIQLVCTEKALISHLPMARCPKQRASDALKFALKARLVRVSMLINCIKAQALMYPETATGKKQKLLSFSIS